MRIIPQSRLWMYYKIFVSRQIRNWNILWKRLKTLFVLIFYRLVTYYMLFLEVYVLKAVHKYGMSTWQLSVDSAKVFCFHMKFTGRCCLQFFSMRNLMRLKTNSIGIFWNTCCNIIFYPKWAFKRRYGAYFNIFHTACESALRQACRFGQKMWMLSVSLLSWYRS